MTPKNPAAFPLHPGVMPDWHESAGMTLRDHFAGQIAAALCSATDSTGLWMAPMVDGGADIVARRAYDVADAMLRAREAVHA